MSPLSFPFWVQSVSKCTAAQTPIALVWRFFPLLAPPLSPSFVAPTDGSHYPGRPCQLCLIHHLVTPHSERARERERFTLTQPSLLPATAPLRDSTETEDKGDEHGWGRRPDSLIGGKIMELKEPGMATLSDILFLSNWILWVNDRWTKGSLLAYPENTFWYWIWQYPVYRDPLFFWLTL